MIRRLFAAAALICYLIGGAAPAAAQAVSLLGSDAVVQPSSSSPVRINQAFGSSGWSVSGSGNGPTTYTGNSVQIPGVNPARHFCFIRVGADRGWEMRVRTVAYNAPTCPTNGLGSVSATGLVAVVVEDGPPASVVARFAMNSSYWSSTAGYTRSGTQTAITTSEGMAIHARTADRVLVVHTGASGGTLCVTGTESGCSGALTWIPAAAAPTSVTAAGATATGFTVGWSGGWTGSADATLYVFAQEVASGLTVDVSSGGMENGGPSSHAVAGRNASTRHVVTVCTQSGGMSCYDSSADPGIQGVEVTTLAPGEEVSPWIQTVAGTGTDSFSGDGGAATSATINNPNEVTLDSAGNLYIADSSNHRIRKVDASGNISTIAGTGTAGFGGDGGAATAAQLNFPAAVVVDSAGNLYFADSNNHRVRRVDTSGDISTVAGTGTGGFSSDGGPATAAQLNFPAAVVVDSAGNLYIADSNNHRIRKVDASGDISTVAGTGTGGFSGDGGPASGAMLNGPQGIVLDGAGNLYIVGSASYRIRKVDASGTISTIAGTGTAGFSGDGGAATAAQLNWPSRVAMDGAGNLYISDRFNHRIRKVDASGDISTIAGTGTAGFGGDVGAATAARLNYPIGVAVDGASRYIYVADALNNRIRRIAGVAQPRPPAGPSPVAPVAPPNLPPVAAGEFEALALDPDERLEVSLLGKFRDPEGGELTYSAGTSNAEVAEAGVSDGQLWVEGRSPGTARVVVTATDAGGLRAVSGFLVQVGVVVSFAADASAPEGGTLRLRLVASQPADGDLSVAYALAAAGGEASAADESDHDGGTGGAATIASGEMEAAIEIAILDDAQVEPPREFFALVLSPPEADAGYVLGLKTRAQATIEEGVCDRAAPVRDALRGRGGCAAVADLSSLLVLDLAGSGAEALLAEDFLDLSGLRVLDLSGNRLSSWPSAVLAGLPNLISLRLNGNRLRELPAGALAAHPRLIGLHLADNALSALPPGAFRELAELRRLDLSGNALSELPGDVIAGLSGLWTLRLNDNLLAELPTGLFEGVSGLRELWLQGNPGAPFVLRLELARTDAEPWAPGPASVAARVAEGAPFALRTLLSATGEALPEGAALSVPAGAIASEPTMLPQGEANLVWARLAGASPVPDDRCELADGAFVPCFQGIATAASSPLALFKRAPVPVGPVEPMALRVDGDALRLDLASQFTAAPGEALSYAAESSNPSAVRVRIDNGALIAEAVGEGIATITIRATDGDGLSAILRFVVQSQRTARSSWQGWRLILLQPQDATQ